MSGKLTETIMGRARRIVWAGLAFIALAPLAAQAQVSCPNTTNPDWCATNTATVAPPADVVDSTPGNNSSEVSNRVLQPVTVTKNVTGAPAGGVSGDFGFTFTCGTATYPGTISLTNATTGTAMVNIPRGSSCTLAETSKAAAPTGYAWGTETYTQLGGPVSSANNAATIINPLSPIHADLVTTKTVDNATPAVGSNVVFTLAVTNNGPSDATGVSLTDQLPSGYAYVSHNASVGTYDSGTGVWTIGGLTNGASATLAITATVNASGEYTNTTTAASGNETDPTTTGDDLTETTTPTAVADVSVTKVLDTAGPYVVGQTVSYTITVSNAGPSPATNVEVTDTPTNLSNLVFTGACTAMPCTIASIASGATETIAVTGTITADGAFSNSATATPSETDPDPGNNTGTDGGNAINVIDAVDDVFGPVNGGSGGSAGNAYANDTLNGAPVDPAQVTGTVLTPATPIGGGPVPVLDPATGEVTVPPGTPAGSYTIEYQICEVLNPTNCDTASITVTVSAPVIDAVDDDFSGAPINGGSGGTTTSVLVNDTLNGSPVVPAQVTLTPGTSPHTGLVMNPDGTITVSAGTPAGTYTYPYTICEVLNPSNCDTATAAVVVAAAPIVATDDVFGPVNGASGGSAGNAYSNDTLNGAPVTPGQVTGTVLTPATPIGGGPVPVL
ncbi:DUF5979 domain-containing protein, partial [Luteimonas sp. e5]